MTLRSHHFGEQEERRERALWILDIDSVAEYLGVIHCCCIESNLLRGVDLFVPFERYLYATNVLGVEVGRQGHRGCDGHVPVCRQSVDPGFECSECVRERVANRFAIHCLVGPTSEKSLDMVNDCSRQRSHQKSTLSCRYECSNGRPNSRAQSAAGKAILLFETNATQGQRTTECELCSGADALKTGYLFAQ